MRERGGGAAVGGRAVEGLALGEDAIVGGLVLGRESAFLALLQGDRLDRILGGHQEPVVVVGPHEIRVHEDFGDAVKTYLDNGPCTLGKPSTIVWIMDDKVEVIRQGEITQKQIEDVLNA